MANGTPICQEPLSQEFGHISKGPAAGLDLAGTYNYAGVDTATVDILWEITQTQSQVPVDSILTIIGQQDWHQILHSQ